MFNNKTFNFIILGAFLLIIYLCYRDKKRPTTDLNNKEFYTQLPDSIKKSPLKSILRKTKCSNKGNKQVSFILPNEDEYSFVDVNKMKLPQTQFQIPLEENTDNNVCLNNKLDLYDSYPGRLDKIKNCSKVKGPVAIKDVYDGLIVDYKRDIKEKDLLNNSQQIEPAAFGLSSYVNTNWSYKNENSNNGGIMEDGLYAMDPTVSNTAIIS